MNVFASAPPLPPSPSIVVRLCLLVLLQVHFELGDVCDERPLFVAQLLEVGNNLLLALRDAGRFTGHF